MQSIQVVGSDILTGKPKKFYIFGGSEYGIKCSYLSMLQKYYHGHVSESESAMEVIHMLSRKRLVPIPPSLYIIRYDDEFVSSVSEKSAELIKNCDIPGTVVCLYESEKQLMKLDKYLPDFTVTIDAVSKHFIEKYLSNDFPQLDERLRKVCATISENYGQAKNLCRSICMAPDKVAELDDETIAYIFGFSRTSQSSQIRAGVASRNSSYLLSILDNYEDTYDSVLYTMLSTMLELEKLLTNNRAQSDIRQYANRWTLKDMYYYFHHVYNAIKKLRSTTSDGYAIVIYLASLLAFREIPREEDL